MIHMIILFLDIWDYTTLFFLLKIADILPWNIQKSKPETTRDF